MSEKILKKDNFAEFINKVVQEYEVYAPVMDRSGINFKHVKDASKIVMDYHNSVSPPKEIILPRAETLFEFKKDGKEVEIIAPKQDEVKRLILGIRPCDAQAYGLLEMFFDFGEFSDEMVEGRMENSILMGLACNHPSGTCFCTSIGGHPFRKDDMDIFMVDLGDKFILEAVSDKGIKFLEPIGILQDASTTELKLVDDMSKNAESEIKMTVNTSNAKDIINDNFYDKVWEEISDTCLGCGSCSFLCPTCHCFDVIDENDYANNRGRRIRVWDTCQRTDFTLHTSGHNPRTEKKQRCRQRIAHKFSYYPNNYNLLGCVGCGRCVKYCPVNNDTREILKKINQISEKREMEADLIE